MPLASTFNTDESPYVLQLVLRTARSEAAVNRSIKAIAQLADQAFAPRTVQASWAEPVTHRIVVRRAGSLAPSLRKSAVRVTALTNDCADSAGDLKISGWELVRREDVRFEKIHYICTGMNDHGALADCISYVVHVIIRLDNLVRDSPNAWRSFVRRGVAAVAANGCHGCGVADIIPVTRHCFGDAFTCFGQPQSFLRAVLWSRWAASAARGDDFVPWPGQAVVLSPDSVSKAGGLANLSKIIGNSVATIRSRITEVPVEGVPGGGAIVWLAPSFEDSFPNDEFSSQLYISHDTREDAASIYRALQELGVAL